MSGLKAKFGCRLKELRKKSKFSQEVFAEKIGISTRNLSKIETGITFPSPATIESIVSVLNCSELELFDFGHLDDVEKLRNEIINKVKNFDKNKIAMMFAFLKIID